HQTAAIKKSLFQEKHPTPQQIPRHGQPSISHDLEPAEHHSTPQQTPPHNARHQPNHADHHPAPPHNQSDLPHNPSSHDHSHTAPTAARSQHMPTPTPTSPYQTDHKAKKSPANYPDAETDRSPS